MLSFFLEPLQGRERIFVLMGSSVCATFHQGQTARLGKIAAALYDLGTVTARCNRQTGSVRKPGFGAAGGIVRLGMEATTMEKEYTAVVKQEGDWWLGWIEEVPGVNCQEKTHEELMDTLAVTLREALELNRQDALKAAGSDFREETVTL